MSPIIKLKMRKKQRNSLLLITILMLSLLSGISFTIPIVEAQPNHSPVISNEYPTNQSTGISITPTLHIQANDVDANTMNVAWHHNTSAEHTLNSVYNLTDQAFPYGDEARYAVWINTTESVYLFGGLTSSGQEFDIFKWNVGNVPTQLSNATHSVKAPAPVWDWKAGKIYVYCNDSIYWLDPSDDSNGTTTEGYGGYYHNSFAAYSPIQNKSYIFGGRNYSSNTVVNYTWVHDAGASTFTRMMDNNLTLPVTSMSGAYVPEQDAIYLLGARGAPAGTMYDDIYRFNCSTETLTNLKTIYGYVKCPTDVEGMGVFYHPDDQLIYCFGGLSDEPAYPTYLDGIWTFNPFNYTASYPIVNLSVTLPKRMDDFSGIFNTSSGYGYLLPCNDVGSGDNDETRQRYITQVNFTTSYPWVQFATNASIPNGTYYQTNSNFSEYDTKYWWSANLTDGTDWDNETYYFTTAIDGWWDNKWNYYRTITIDHTQIETPLTNFPLMVYIPATIAPSCDGGDSIRFISTDNGTAFNYEIEYWHVDGSYVWVNISEVITSGSSYEFLMYYNNSDASDNQNPTGVWDSNYQCVYHLNEASGNIQDSTSYANTGTKIGSPTYSQTGQIGTAIEFDGASDCFGSVLDKADLNHNTSFFEFWLKPDGVSENGIVLGWVYVGDNRFMLGQNEGEGGKWRYGWGDQHEYYGTPDTNWHYLSYIVTPEEVISAYVDSVFAISENSAAFSSGSTNIYMGVGIANTSAYRFDGLIDEVRISNSSRNVSWMNASFHTMNQTTGFLTWGSETASLGNPTGFIATTLSNSEIFLNWTKTADASHTYLVRKTGGYPTGRTDGTNIYNSTGVNYTDDIGLSIMTEYFYSAWGFNSTTGNWSVSVTATNHTGPANPTNVDGDVGASYFNMTWTKGARADNTTVVRKATGFPTSPTDGTEMYNSSGLFYNDTGFSGGYYKLFSWNDTVNLFSSGVNAPYGSLTISVYDEGNGTAITGWDVFITNQNGTQTYENLNNSNPLVIDINDLPTGDDVAIQINATGYNSSAYYMDLETNNQYTLDAHLGAESDTELYLLTVDDESDNGVSDATLKIERYINDTVGYELITQRITDANGQVAVYLTPFVLYKVTISKTGYDTEISDYTPSDLIFTKTFKIKWEIVPVEPDTFGDIVSFYGTLYVNNTLMVSFYDLDNAMIDSHFIVYEDYNDTLTYMDEYNGTTSNDITFWVNVVNATRLHIIVLFMNHSTLGVVSDYRIVVYPVHVGPDDDRVSGTWLENLIRSVVGDFDYGYVLTFIWFFPCVLLIGGLAALKHPGIGILGAGLYSIWITWNISLPEEARILTFASIALVTGSVTLFLVKGKKVVH